MQGIGRASGLAHDGCEGGCGAAPPCERAEVDRAEEVAPWAKCLLLFVRGQVKRGKDEVFR